MEKLLGSEWIILALILVEKCSYVAQSFSQASEGGFQGASAAMTLLCARRCTDVTAVDRLPSSPHSPSQHGRVHLLKFFWHFFYPYLKALLYRVL